MNRKYRLYGGCCRKWIFADNFTDITILMILFHLQKLGAGRHIPGFLNFWIIKFRKILEKQNWEFYVFSFMCIFLLERYRKLKHYECDGLGNSIPYKMMFVSASSVKNCGRRWIFRSQSAIFRGSEKHIVIIIIIIYHDFLPPPRRGSHVKPDNTHTHTHTQSSRYTPLPIYLTPEPWFSVVAPFLHFIITASCQAIPPLSMW